MKQPSIHKFYRMSKKPTRNHDGVKICVYCNRTIEGILYLTKEHLVPKSKGGKDTVMNLRASCNLCNHWRGDMELDEWIKQPGLSMTQIENIKDLIAFVNQYRDRLTKKFNLERRLHGINARWDE